MNHPEPLRTSAKDPGQARFSGGTKPAVASGRAGGGSTLGAPCDRSDGSPEALGEDQAEVRVALRAWRDEFEAGVAVGESVTFGEFARWWLDEVAPSRRGRNGNAVSASTPAKDRVLAENHLIAALGAHQLRDLAPEHVERMLKHKLTVEGLGHDWVRRLRARLIEILRQAERRGRVRPNVAAISVMPDTGRSVAQCHLTFGPGFAALPSVRSGGRSPSLALTFTDGRSRARSVCFPP